ncbi:MAG: hypothetical protein V4731_16825 [Pseudomonadota bacterium]
MKQHHHALNNAAVAEMAAVFGILSEGQALPPGLRDFTRTIVEQCATVGEKYHHPLHDGTAGDHIRACFLLE